MLRQVADLMELAKLLCIRGQPSAAASPTRPHALDEAESLAATIGAGPDSELGCKIAQLREALA